MAGLALLPPKLLIRSEIIQQKAEQSEPKAARPRASTNNSSEDILNTPRGNAQTHPLPLPGGEKYIFQSVKNAEFCTFAPSKLQT